MEVRGDRHDRSTQGCLEGSERELVDAQRPGEGVPPQPLDGVCLAEDETGLWAAEELVAARGHYRRTVSERRCGIGLVGQE